MTMVIHATAGGGSDIFGRTMPSAIDKDKLLPQPIVVENKPGGSGGIAFAYVAGKKKDPYYLVTAVTSFPDHTADGFDAGGPEGFHPHRHFAFDEYMLIVNLNSKYQSVKDVVADAKANPKKITVGGTQLGSSGLDLRLSDREGCRRPAHHHIVFSGGGEAIAALLGGHIDMAVANPCEALELYKVGQGPRSWRFRGEAPCRRPRRSPH